MDYEDFELQIGPRWSDGTLVRVLRSPAGTGEATVDLDDVAGPPSERFRDLSPPTPAVRREETPNERGSRLFTALFAEPLRGLLVASLAAVRGRSPACGLRIKLRINPRDPSIAHLQSVPWELLYWSDIQDFLALQRWTPVVRWLEVPRPPQRLPFTPPLRILFVLAQARDLDLKSERTRIEKHLEYNAAIQSKFLEDPDPQTLRNVLDDGGFQVLHFMGHAGFNEESGEGSLRFSVSGGASFEVSGQHLATKLKDCESLRLVVLNACDTAKASSTIGSNPFAGVAAALVLAGLPAVVAMQWPVADPHALAFSEAFYGRLARGMAVDEALTEGRQAIHSARPSAAAWAVPVLYLHTSEHFPLPMVEPASAAPRRTLRRAALALGMLGILWFVALASLPARLEEGTGPTTPVETTVPSPSPTPQRQTVPPSRIVTVGNVQFHISSQGLPMEAFSAALRKSANALGSSSAKVEVTVGAPNTSDNVEEGVSFTVCRFRARCRVSGRDLVPINVGRSDIFADQACDLAAEALAEAVVQTIIPFLSQEGSS